MKEYDRFLPLAIASALKAGAAIMEIYNGPIEAFDVHYKADHSPLTQADKAAHSVIAEALATTPYPLLSEEGGIPPYTERSSWQQFWLVDPLDGTKEFIKRNGEFTVNIALIDNGVPVMGVIYVPVLHLLYYASDDLGAFRVDEIAEGTATELDELQKHAYKLPFEGSHEGLVVVASRTHLNDDTIEYIDYLRRIGESVRLITSGSSLKICRVAEGTADLYPRFAPTMEWDTAAGHAIALAAGRQIYKNDEKTPLVYNKYDLHNPWFVVKKKN